MGTDGDSAGGDDSHAPTHRAGEGCEPRQDQLVLHVGGAAAGAVRNVRVAQLQGAPPPPQWDTRDGGGVYTVVRDESQLLGGGGPFMPNSCFNCCWCWWDPRTLGRRGRRAVLLKWGRSTLAFFPMRNTHSGV